MKNLSIRNKGLQAPSNKNDPSIEVNSEHLAALAKSFRISTAGDSNWTYPNFNRTIELGGRCFLISDLIALVSAYLFSDVLAAALGTLWHEDAMSQLALTMGNVQQLFISFVLGVMAIVWLTTKGHYRQRLPHWESLGHFVTVALIGFVSGGFIQYALKDNFSRLQLGLFWVLFGLLILCGRILVRRMLESRGLWEIKTLVIGTRQTAQSIISALTRESQMGYKIVSQLSPVSLFHLQKSNAWKELLMLYEADHVFVALEGSEIETHQTAMKTMVRSRIPYSIVPPWHGLPSSNVSSHHFMMRDVMVLHNTNRLRQPGLLIAKRCFDIAAAGCAVLMLLPVMAVVALLVRRDGGPAMFSQVRIGLNGELFRCLKFRSMRVDAEDMLQQYLAQNPDAAQEWEQFQKLKDDVRITKFGKFIRRTSLDELPQLLNVLKGDMSIVGPRPITPGQDEFYGEDFCYYEAVRPGITGPWQVSGRSKLTFKERIALEGWYARNWNLWMDIVIILKTFPTLLKRGHAV